MTALPHPALWLSVGLRSRTGRIETCVVSGCRPVISIAHHPGFPGAI